MLQGNQLSGFGGVAPERTSIAFFDSSTDVEGNTMTLPAGTVAGDVAVIIDAGGLLDDNIPTDFVSMLSVDNGNFRIIASYKILVGGEGTLTVATDGGAGISVRVCLVFRPSAPISTVNFGTWSSSFSASGDPADVLVEAEGVNSPLVVIGAKVTAGGSATVTGSPSLTATVLADDTGGDLRVGYLIYGPGDVPADNTLSTTDQGGNQYLAGGYLAMA